MVVRPTGSRRRALARLAGITGGAALVVVLLIGALAAWTNVPPLVLENGLHVFLRDITFIPEPSSEPIVCGYPLPISPPDPILEKDEPVFRVGAMSRPDVGFANLVQPVLFTENREPRSYRVPHRWPRQTFQPETGGCVVYEFTVMASGAVADVAVLDSSNPLFEAAGRQAVEQYRYPPKKVNGEPVMQPGQTIRLVWQVEGEPLPNHPACPESETLASP